MVSLLDKSVDELFPRKHMKVEDLCGKAWTVKVVRVQEIEVYNDRKNVKEAAVALCFENAKRYLIINKTRADKMVEITGQDKPRWWVGHRIMVVPVNGKRGWTIGIMQPPHEEVGEETEAEAEEAAAEAAPVPA